MEAINLFPESRFLRMKRNAKLDHQCGGCASLIIIVGLLVILIVKLIQVFAMKTVFFTTQTAISLEPVMTNITTFQNDPTQSPYMLAVYLSNLGCTTRVTSIQGFHVSVYNNRAANQLTVPEPIVLEPCTSEHFSSIPAIKNNVDSLGITNWGCLPINKTYQIGGSNDISSTYKYLNFQFGCQNACSIDNCGTITVYQLKSLINSNGEQSFSSYLDRMNMDFASRTFNYYNVEMDQNVLNTDSSLFPSQEITTKTSMQNQVFQKRASIPSSQLQPTTLKIQRSAFTYIAHKNHLKLIDVLSYVGGIFPTLFGIFFFIKFFGMYFFEMTFAHRHYKCLEAKYRGFGPFLKNVVYNLAKMLGCPPRNWKIVKKQCEVNDLVNKVLDINYLYKRIEFLESAVSMVLEKHQLKGIYLSQMSITTANHQFKSHRLRDRMIRYLNEKANEENDQREKERIKVLNQKEKEKEMEKEREMIEKTPSSQPIPSKAVTSEGQLKPQQEKPKFMKEERTGKLNTETSFVEKLREDITKSKGRRMSNRKRQEVLLKRRDDILLVASQFEMTEEMDDEEFDEDQISEQLEGDLKKLFKEAKNKKGDPVSKRIVEQMDDWLKSELQIAIEDYEEQNPRFEYRLRDPSLHND